MITVCVGGIELMLLNLDPWSSLQLEHWYSNASVSRPYWNKSAPWVLKQTYWERAEVSRVGSKTSWCLRPCLKCMHYTHPKSSAPVIISATAAAHRIPKGRRDWAALDHPLLSSTFALSFHFPLPFQIQWERGVDMWRQAPPANPLSHCFTVGTVDNLVLGASWWISELPYVKEDHWPI